MRRGTTTSHFVDDGIEAALERALEAADGNDVRVGGGAATIQQYLRAGLIDDMHLAIVPVRLGGGERLFDHVDGGPDGYECVEFVSSPSVTHAACPNDEVGGRSRPPPVPGHGVQGGGLAAGEADDAEAATGCCEGAEHRTRPNGRGGRERS